MTNHMTINRRALLGGAAALGAFHALGSRARAAGSPSVANLPARGNVLIRNAYVMTMEPGQADLPSGDVHVENGTIVEVGTGLAAPGARVIEGKGFIVLPGMVDTHWHMWTTLLRNMSGIDRAHGYFPMTTALGKVYTPKDMYYGTLLSAAEALHSGITTVHDWCHNIMTPAHADEDIRALQESGIRGRFSYGPARSTPITQPVSIAELERLHNGWASLSNEGLLTLGLAWRGVQGAFPVDGKFETRPLSPDMWRVEYDAARKMNLPISVHLNSWVNDKGHIAAIEKAGLSFKDMQVIHALTSTPEEMKMLAAGGGVLSVSPFSELRIGYGVTKILEFITNGVTVGLSVDTTPLTGNADMFGIMKLAQNIENGRFENEFKLTARKAIELATIEGARSLGLGDRIGSLVKGKRADLIMVGTNDVNIGPFTDAAHMLVGSAQGFNVDTVMVDGRILKAGGKLTAINTPVLMAEASAASLGVRERANWK